jgi:endonuclease-3
MAEAPLEQIQQLVQSTGFFRQKSRALKGAARAILERFGGEIPARMRELLTVPGVGRKTANVLLGHVFQQPGLVVDTHVRRLSLRLGLTRQHDADAIERDLQKLRPPADWTPLSMRLILHGRRICHARSPRCPECLLRPDCPRIGVSRARAVFDPVR